jgi:hypothetical protein
MQLAKMLRDSTVTSYDSQLADSVTYFRARRAGREAEIETALASKIREMFGNRIHPVWVAGSLPIGAGLPDLVHISYLPQVLVLADKKPFEMEVLAYLRTVGHAGLNTLADALRSSVTAATRSLYSLIDAKAVAVTSKRFFYLPRMWRSILPEIVTVEVKVSNWRRAVEQAARNRIFAHRSFIALPELVANRVQHEASIKQLGLGIISVGANSVVRILRRPRRRRPAVWIYYYRLAYYLAKSSRGRADGVHGISNRCPEVFS